VITFLIPVALKPPGDRHRTVQPSVPASSLVASFIFFDAKALVAKFRGDGRIPQSCLDLPVMGSSPLLIFADDPSPIKRGQKMRSPSIIGLLDSPCPAHYEYVPGPLVPICHFELGHFELWQSALPSYPSRAWTTDVLSICGHGPVMGRSVIVTGFNGPRDNGSCRAGLF
jgi:hypothetical protein